MASSAVVSLSQATALPTLYGQGWRQVGELLLAFVLSALIGLERQLRGKAAGLRTQAIVGTTAALILVVSKYGFGDVVLASGSVALDPSRVAAQIVSGVGFLGAGLILTRRGAVRGLTTAAAVWETAAIGMAAAAGLWLLALVVTALHFVIVYGFDAIAHRLPGSADSDVELEIAYDDGHGILRELLASLTGQGWRVGRLEGQGSSGEADAAQPVVAVRVDLVGNGSRDALVASLGSIEGVRSVSVVSDEDLD